MRLVYKSTGDPVKVGDEVKLHNDDRKHFVLRIEEPRTVASTGRVYVDLAPDADSAFMSGYYPSVIDAHWIES